VAEEEGMGGHDGLWIGIVESIQPPKRQRFLLFETMHLQSIVPGAF